MSNLASALNELATVQPELLDDEQLAAGLRKLQTAADRLEATRVRWLAVFDARQGYQRDGAGSSQQWLRDQCRVSWRQAAGQVEVARQLQELPETQAAFAAGEIGERHAQVITKAVADPRLNGSPHAEHELVEAARNLEPGLLSRVARRMQMEADPAAAVEEADRQFARRRLHVALRRDGMVSVDGLLDPVGGEALITALDALSPPEPSNLPQETWRTPAQRRADALSELARRALDSGQLPATGGERPHVSVIVDLHTLQGLTGHQAAELGWSGPICGETARRICCDAGVCRVVSAGRSEVLDLGRRTRLVTPAQRRALVVRDRGCRWCGTPAAWAEAHHVKHWADGGATDLKNLILLCGACHQRVHEGRWQVRLHPDATATFRRPGGPTHTRPPP